jgi:pyruvate ferredoxin oxidoreductase alpha subunit
MGKRIGMEVAVAVLGSRGLCNIDMAAVYPITPQSHIAEHLSDLVADGRMMRNLLPWNPSIRP